MGCILGYPILDIPYSVSHTECLPRGYRSVMTEPDTIECQQVGVTGPADMLWIPSVRTKLIDCFSACYPTWSILVPHGQYMVNTCLFFLLKERFTVSLLAASSAPDKDEGLPASRISDILGASSLSDEDIQQLIQELFEKMNANTEWQAAVSLL